MQSSLRPRARSSAPFSSRFMGGIRQFGQNVADIPRAFADDLTMGLGLVKRNEDNKDR